MGFDQENLVPRDLGSGSILADLVPGLVEGDNIPVRLKLVFPWRSPFEDKELVSTFRHLIGDFLKIVDEFEAVI